MMDDNDFLGMNELSAIRDMLATGVCDLERAALAVRFSGFNNLDDSLADALIDAMAAEAGF
jgi:hypothetical protein